MSTPARSSWAVASARPSCTTPDADAARPGAPGPAPRAGNMCGGGRATSPARRTSTTPGVWPRPPASAPAARRRSNRGLVGPFGIDVPGAWTRAAGMGARGRAGITVAVRRAPAWPMPAAPPYRRSPDLPPGACDPGYELVAHDALPQRAQRARDVRGQRDRRGRRRPLRHDRGRLPRGHHARARPGFARRGSSSAIARGIRYAVDHDAQVIDLSVEFFDLLSRRPYTVASLPQRARGDPLRRRAPACPSWSPPATPARRRSRRRCSTTRSSTCGATTGAAAWADYSNFGHGVDVVAPSRGSDASLPSESICTPNTKTGRNVQQVSFPRGRYSESRSRTIEGGGSG